MENTKGIDFSNIDSWYIPEPVVMTCFKGHNITSQECVVCGKKFAEMDRVDMLEVGCGDENHHICTYCYGNLGEVVD